MYIEILYLFAAFHDCVTICDGCLNMTDSSNAGLQDIIDDLEELYPTYSSLVSRADFWIMAGISSITLGIKASNRQCTDE